MSNIFQGDLSSFQDAKAEALQKADEKRSQADAAKTTTDLVGAPIATDLLKDTVKQKIGELGDFINKGIETDGANIPELPDFEADGTGATDLISSLVGKGSELVSSIGSRAMDAINGIMASRSRVQSAIQSARGIADDYTTADPFSMVQPSFLKGLSSRQAADFNDIMAGRPTAGESLPDNLFNRAIQARESMQARAASVREPDEIDATFRNQAFDDSDVGESIFSRIQNVVQNAGSAGDSTIARALQGAQSSASSAQAEAESIGNTLQSEFASNIDALKSAGLNATEAADVIGTGTDDVASAVSAGLAGAKEAGEALIDSDNPLGVIVGTAITIGATAASAVPEHDKIPNLSRPFITSGLGGQN